MACIGGGRRKDPVLVPVLAIRERYYEFSLIIYEIYMHSTYDKILWYFTITEECTRNQVS